MSTISYSLHPAHVPLSQYSALSNAVPGLQNTQRPTARPIIVPTAPLTPSPGQHLPRLNPTWVDFRTPDGREGVSFANIASDPCRSIAAANEPVFHAPGQESIQVLIAWPGYRHLSPSRSIPIVVNGISITRAQLASKIVAFYNAFFAQARHAHYSASASKENGSWELKQTPSSSRLILKRLSNSQGNLAVFQADIEIMIG
ncbi:hypothetical protein C8Q77DRAFT_1154224 [Trametes polyzona]|nr:hypothetical protein C8Q77DRAFT_1154224 [Trametes polyzona]